MTSRVVAERTVAGQSFRNGGSGPLSLSYYEKAAVTNTFNAEHGGHYQLLLDFSANEKYVDNQFDLNKCQFIFRADGKELYNKTFVREGSSRYHYEFDQNWQPGAHELSFEIQPLTPDEKQVRSLTMRIESVTLRGPLETNCWVEPKDYRRFFAKDVPPGKSERRAYARELLGSFATRAFRRPADDVTVNRLVTLASGLYSQPGQTFESGIAHAMIAVLASPRFLFRTEQIEPQHPARGMANIDEYSLASRLSYFLWSSMPDDELFRLAAEGRLRKNLDAQVKRMLADPRSDALVKNFTGQWLQARDIESVQIDARSVLAREQKADPAGDRTRARFRELAGNQDKLTPAEKAEFQQLRAKQFGRFRGPRADLTPDLRRDMRRETEMYFANIMHEDRSVVELVESDYTFLNERLARHYGLTNLEVTGTDLRRVTLPQDSMRGGVNPTRTSPVKRGLFILDNILGSPTPPPPPNIPPLEESEKAMADHEPTLREVLNIHRAKPVCNSCHGRMDPLGLALENFNAMGMWRTTEHDQTIDVSGQLITGESFKDLRELKHILATNHRDDFYRTLTEKLLTYALGRGLEYYDVETVDQIVSRLQQNDGRFSALLMGIIESAPFQKSRSSDTLAEVDSTGIGRANLK
jgi:hypothetical protein